MHRLLRLWPTARPSHQVAADICRTSVPAPRCLAHESALVLLHSLSGSYTVRRRCYRQRLEMRATRAGDQMFGGDNLDALRAWLESRNLRYGDWGQGGAKSLEELLEEVLKGESVLVEREGAALRLLEIASVIVVTSDFSRALVEDHQVRPDGAVRRRNLLLSEKLLPGEQWQAAAHRALTEELGSALDGGTLQCDLFTQTYSVAGCVRNIPQDRDFCTCEPRPGGLLRNHWRWVGPEWSEQVGEVLQQLRAEAC